MLPEVRSSVKAGRKKRGGRATIQEVAHTAGVSIGTVSRVINGRSDVDPSLQARVGAAIRELDYRPNLRAQNLVRDKSPIVSFVLSNLGGLNPVNSLILQGIEDYCAEAGFFVLFARCQYSPTAPAGELRLPSVLLTHGLADSVILAGINYDNFVDALQQRGLNCVVLANNMVSSRVQLPVDRVRFDDFGGCYEATKYLIQLGHRDIWYVGDTAQPWYRVRHEAYERAMREHQLEPRAQTLSLSDDAFENGHTSVGLILEGESPVTAILAGSVELAYGAMDALRQHGRDVPRAVSVIGFDYSLAWTRMTNLTTVCVDAVEVGRQLAKMAIAKANSPGRKLPEVVVAAGLVKRSTCRPFRPSEGMVL